MNCPRCADTELTEQSIAEVAIDRCPTCRGIWLDCFELERLLESDPKPLLIEDKRFHAAEDDGRRLSCPRCKAAQLIKLNSRVRPGTILDSCTVCHGTWLDPGELTRLAHADFVGRIRALFHGES